MTPEEMVTRLLYRDGLMLIIDKPAGLSVHKGPKGGPSLEDHFDALRFGLPRLPSLAHRLDKETSGCLVLGRHRKALATLGDLFRYGKVGKTYWAVVEGGPEEGEGRIDLPLGKLDDTRGWWMKHDPNGLPSTTTWKVMGRMLLSPHTDRSVGDMDSAPSVPSPLVGEGQGGGYAARSESSNHPPPQPSPTRGEGADRSSRTSTPETAKPAKHLTWLALEPLTGRTHQLRVHCATMGWPILGDDIYGSSPRKGGGPGLHLQAREVIVPLYKNKPPIHVTAPVPPHMRERLKACGWQQEPERPPLTMTARAPAPSGA
jgi:tRNA pseudouridine32 synthase / 23S rRNA pseudouridine746 synthase